MVEELLSAQAPALLTQLSTHFLKKVYSFIYYVYSILPACAPAPQKRALDLIIDGCEPPCGCWKLNSGPLEEESVLLTAEPSLQPLFFVFLFVFSK